jgi:hypothetical protein
MLPHSNLDKTGGVVSNKIDGNKPVTPHETEVSGSPETREANAAQESGQAQRSSESLLEKYGPSEAADAWKDYVDGDAPRDAAAAATGGGDQEFAPFKAGLAAAGGRPEDIPTARESIEAHPQFDAIVDILQNDSIDADDLVSDDSALFMTDGKLEAQLLSKLDVGSKGELASLCEDTDALESVLAEKIGERSDVEAGSAQADRLAGVLTREIQASAASVVTEATKSRVVQAADDAEAFLETMETPQTKRTIGLLVADTNTPKEQKIASVRENFGLSQEAAEDLIDGMHGESPQDATEHLQEWIDDRKSGLDDLRDRAKSGDTTDSLMLSEFFESTRADALDSAVDAYGPGIEQAFEAEQARRQDAADKEQYAIGTVQFVTALGATALTGGTAGVIIGAATAGAQSAPGVATAQADVAAGHASDLAGTSDGNMGEQAEFERNVEVGKAIASVAFGAATGGGTKLDGTRKIPGAADYVKTGSFSVGTEAADWGLSSLFD